MFSWGKCHLFFWSAVNTGRNPSQRFCLPFLSLWLLCCSDGAIWSLQGQRTFLSPSSLMVWSLTNVFLLYHCCNTVSSFDLYSKSNGGFALLNFNIKLFVWYRNAFLNVVMLYIILMCIYCFILFVMTYYLLFILYLF